MVQSIYIDNYKCFDNTEINLNSFNLLIGDNGAGKTAFFEVLSAIKKLVIDEKKIGDVFSSRTLTRWQHRNTQTIELVVEDDGRVYTYRLEVEHDLENVQQRIQKECLHLDGRPLFSFELGEVQLYRDDFSKGPTYPFDWSRSALATIMPRNDNKQLTHFKRRLANTHILRIAPFSMTAESKKEATQPDVGFTNFASWYRHVSQERPNQQLEFFDDLREVIDGFQMLRMLSDGGERRIMEMQIDHNTDASHDELTSYRFDELSDGQRALIVLYAIMRFTLHKGTILCIDEPENYLALPEIQPWLLELEMACQESDAQAILISHHPELIDLLALEKGLLFSRSSAGPVRTQPIDVDELGRITVSDFVARGWINE